MKRITKALMITALVGCIGVLSVCTKVQAGNSGFLGDYSGLKKSKDVKGARAYFNPDKSLKEYDAFIIDPVRIHFAPGADATAIDPQKTAELAQYFREKLISELKVGGYIVIDKPGSNTLTVRMAITDLKKTNKLLNIHPGMKLSGKGLGGASFEGEGVDSVTGERIFAVSHSKKGSRKSMKAGLSEWGHAQQSMDFWTKTFVEHLNAAK